MLDDLKALVAVVEERSLTRAAVRLSVTQSAISRRIQALETTLNGMLLDRVNRPTSPTLLGTRVYEHALRVISETDALLQLPQEDAEPTGTFRLGLAYALSESLALPIVQALASRFPALDVRLKTGWSSTLEELIDSAGLDAAIALLAKTAVPPSNSRGRKAGEIQIGIVQSRRRPLIRKKVYMADLANQNWILNPLGCSYRAELEHALGVSGRQLRVAVDTYDAELQLNMVAAGLGLGIASPMLLAQSSFKNRIQRLNVADFSLNLDVWTLHKGQLGNLSKPIRLVAEVVQSVISK